MRLLLLFMLSLVGAIAAYLSAIHIEIERRDENALFAHFLGQHVNIVDSVDSTADQTCFEFEVSEPRPGRTTKKVAMIASGGHDQDNWGYSGEFRTMQQCTASFLRG